MALTRTTRCGRIGYLPRYNSCAHVFSVRVRKQLPYLVTISVPACTARPSCGRIVLTLAMTKCCSRCGGSWILQHMQKTRFGRASSGSASGSFLLSFATWLYRTDCTFSLEVQRIPWVGGAGFRFHVFEYSGFFMEYRGWFSSKLLVSNRSATWLTAWYKSSVWILQLLLLSSCQLTQPLDFFQIA